MDYDKIEQLIRAYWDGETSVEEEALLKAFFREQGDLPEALEKWRGWFSEMNDVAAGVTNAGLDAGFDAEILAYIADEEQQYRRVRLLRRLRVAAACVALFVLGVTGWEMARKKAEEKQRIEMAQYVDEYEQVKDLFYLVSEKMNEAEKVLQDNFEKIDQMNEIVTIK